MSDGREWVDPNNPPADVSLSYIAGGVAPHVQTVRATYTVPANRFAIVEAWYVEILRDAVAGVAGGVFAAIFMPTGFLNLVDSNGNALGDLQRDSGAGHVLLTTGQTISAQTFDGSTGGSHTFRISVQIREYLM